MSLELYHYTFPDSTVATSGAIGWFGNLNLDFENSRGFVSFLINRDVNAANSGLPPGERENYILGQDELPSFSQVLSDNAAAFNSIRSYLYGKFQGMSKFSNSTQV